MTDVYPLLPGALSSSLQADTDAFNLRLREVNREMQDILEKTSERRRDLSRWQAATDVAPLTPHPRSHPTTTSSTAAAVTTHSEIGAPAAFAVTEELRHWIAEQVAAYVASRLPHAVAPLVEQHVGRQLQRTVDRLDGLRESQEELRVAVDNHASLWKERVTALSTAVARVEASSRRVVQSAEADAQAAAQRWLAEAAAARDGAAAAEQRLQLLEQRLVRRLDDVVRDHQDTLRATIATVHRDGHTWREEVGAMLRGQLTDLQARREETEAHVARLQGALEGVAESASQHAVDLRTLMDGAVGQASEVRMCRRDVNRLEMYVQCVADCVSGGEGGGGGRTHLEARPHGSESPAGLLLLAQELGHAREQIALLSNRVEGLERHVHQMDVAMLATGWGGRAPGQRIAGGGSSPSRGPASPTASTHRPSAAPPSSGAPSMCAGYEESNPPSATASHDRLRQPYPQQRARYPLGMNHSVERPMSATVGAMRSSTLTSATSLPYGQPQPHQGLSSFMSQSTVRTVADADRGPGGAPAPARVLQPLREGRVFHSLAQPPHRPTRAAAGVGESLSEGGRGAAVEGGGASSSAGVPQERQPTQALGQQQQQQPAASEAVSVSPYSLKTSPAYSALAGFMAAESSAGTPAITNKDDDVDAAAFTDGRVDEDSYVSRDDPHTVLESTGSRPPGPTRLEDSGQYAPAPTSDTESERENQNLSRLPID